MLGIGRTAAIAHQEQLLAAAISDDRSFGQTPDVFQQFRGKAPFYGTAFLDLLSEEFERHVFGYSHLSAKFVAHQRFITPLWVDQAIHDNTKACGSYARIAVCREICYPYCQ